MGIVFGASLAVLSLAERDGNEGSCGGRVVAFEPAKDDWLRVVDETRVSVPVRALAADGGRVYAATRDAVMVLYSKDLGTVETVEFGPVLRCSPLPIPPPSP